MYNKVNIYFSHTDCTPTLRLYINLFKSALALTSSLLIKINEFTMKTLFSILPILPSKNRRKQIFVVFVQAELLLCIIEFQEEVVYQIYKYTLLLQIQKVSLNCYSIQVAPHIKFLNCAGAYLFFLKLKLFKIHFKKSTHLRF